MKMMKRLIPLLLFVLAMVGIGCLHGEKKEVKTAIKEELDLLKNLDSDTAAKYISYSELFPEADQNQVPSEDIREVFSLFFQDFDYRILQVDVDRKQDTASASLRLTTLDASAFAKDFTAAKLEQEIHNAAKSDNQANDESSLSLAELYLLMKELLQSEEYDTVERNSTVELECSENGTWEIKRTYSLENDLVGGLMTYLSDPDILSPQDTLAVYLDTLKKMDNEEMSSFLGVESILNSSEPTKNAIASALVELVHKDFNYQFGETVVNGYTAKVSVEITTFDSDAILDAYESQLEEYMSSPDAVIDGLSKRLEKSYDMLLTCIESNNSTTTATAELTLTNDGVAWRLDENNTNLGTAIFGTLSTSPVNETDTENGQ